MKLGIDIMQQAQHEMETALKALGKANNDIDEVKALNGGATAWTNLSSAVLTAISNVNTAIGLVAAAESATYS